MFCSKTSNNIINKIHERILRFILNDHISDFDTLLQNNNGTCNHRNIQTLMVEIYKIDNNLNPPIMDFMFDNRYIIDNNTHDIRNFEKFAMKRKKTVKMGRKTLNYRFSQFWSIFLKIKDKSVGRFNLRMKELKKRLF